MDALYRILRRNFGLPLLPTSEKLVVDVSVTQHPGQTSPWFGAPDRISVPSPAVYWTPVELADVDLLAQSIVLPLLEQVLAQASEQDHIGVAWQPMMSGLQLWQVWDLALPLATWREGAVRWLYADLTPSSAGQAVMLPDQYEALCDMHTLWMPSPAQLEIPLICTDLDREAWFFASWGRRDPLTRLDQLALPVRPDNKGTYTGYMQQLQLPTRTVALATLVEYAVATYGRERLPTLVAGLGQYDSWATLIPAVYGVSAAEFEVGWQAYLKAHYGIASAN